MRRMKRIGIAVGALLLLTSCGGSDDKPAAPKVFDARGTMTLTSEKVIGDGGDGCLGSGGYDDIRGGAPVVVFDDKGKKVGIGELEDGRASSTVRCVFNFTVDDVPVGGTIYSIEVSHRGEMPFKRADAKELALTLG